MGVIMGYRHKRPTYNYGPSRDVSIPKPKSADPMVVMEKAANAAVNDILRKEDIAGAGIKVATNTSRVLVEIVLPETTGVAHHRVSGLVSTALETLKLRIFGDKRYKVHHTVVVNGRRLAYSY
jgi:hypothetical protein